MSKKNYPKLAPIMWFVFGGLMCIGIVLAVSLFYESGGGKTDSRVQIKYLGEIEISVETAHNFTKQSEREMFNKQYLNIFVGTVSDIENIEISFDGRWSEYRAIVHVNVEDIIQGDISEGEVVPVLLGVPINTKLPISDSAVIENLRVGQRAIFMPIKFNNENSGYYYDNIFLNHRDLAEYALLDPMRWTFIESSNGLLFDRDTYSGAKNATSLNEIKEYILSFVGQ